MHSTPDLRGFTIQDLRTSIVVWLSLCLHYVFYKSLGRWRYVYTPNIKGFTTESIHQYEYSDIFSYINTYTCLCLSNPIQNTNSRMECMKLLNLLENVFVYNFVSCWKNMIRAFRVVIHLQTYKFVLLFHILFIITFSVGKIALNCYGINTS